LNWATIRSKTSNPACLGRIDVVGDGSPIEAPLMVIDAAAWLVLVPIIILGLAIWRAKT
jgi:hypothetical protein